jgi:hypothetical protein
VQQEVARLAEVLDNELPCDPHSPQVPGEEASKSHVIVGFGPQPNTLLIITSSGSFYKVGHQ